MIRINAKAQALANFNRQLGIDVIASRDAAESERRERLAARQEGRVAQIDSANERQRRDYLRYAAARARSMA